MIYQAKIIFIFIALLVANVSFSQKLIVNSQDPNRPIFKAFPVSKISEKSEDLLKVFMVQDGIISETALLGDYSQIKDTVFFKPYFALGSGLLFNAYFYSENDTIQNEYKTQPVIFNRSKGVTVKEIYPRTNKIYKNILTFHVEFSEPMEQNELAFKFINVYDENKVIVPHVWYNKSRWINDKILILMIHPGRVKNGVSYFEDLGELFKEGKKYFLEINDKLRPHDPTSKLKPYIKEFQIISASTSIPKFLQNKMNSPKIKTFDKLRLQFDKPMDFYSILNGVHIKVYNTDEEVEGNFEAGSNDCEWYFVPTNSWNHKEYTLLFNKYVSDLSGNNLVKSFETKSIKSSYTNFIVKKIDFKTQ
ncbi:hypothetical protein CHRY9390_02414 [Chryseobacterium aquaeductus]|uniref:SbsA Ig-like domain-containing protein n=1 Tax=Chryseobacterium aquaeductus TaxID=2675056 RepID=A0A9N8MHQ3_9FLAO|nr:Ig-like domain-containing protein [Chryseobacterium aquaeductus]CAA7331700.1 hypothetical protein CHRY9390_02414 [Chryseobacterium potabilaquae]CAD7811779.1 hypothetical protein CHRY9390_02414 [Chryseobacterium aquaeductus]